ncbi:NUDIX hydrolase [Litoribrevibacter albus]|uniref:NUDIX hydrolase n=2 Tax=Litoribrevibacter albus TaxID=1473156 RepID=A0AA37W753_9GAMM|nr:NUDIX hydrolase [Litoribrevibacter albus]
MDNRLRHVCTQCKTIHYQNPRIVAGTLPFYEDKVLLCKRAIEPRLGYWTLPAGFMENEETTPNAAIRETLEEANARVHLGQLISIIDVPHISQVHMFFAAELADLNYSSGPESLEVELFAEADIPWDELAFPTVKRTLKHFLKAKENNVLIRDIELLVDYIDFKDRIKK